MRNPTGTNNLDVNGLRWETKTPGFSISPLSKGEESIGSWLCKMKPINGSMRILFYKIIYVSFSQACTELQSKEILGLTKFAHSLA